MKKMSKSQLHGRLKLGREILRVLTDQDLEYVSGGKFVQDYTTWPPQSQGFAGCPSNYCHADR